MTDSDLPTYLIRQDHDSLDYRNYRLISNFETIDLTDSESREAAFNAAYRADLGWISRLKIGVRHENRQLGIHRLAQNPTVAQLLAANPSIDRNGDGQIGLDEMQGFSFSGLPGGAFMDGASGLFPRNWLGGSVDFAATRAGLGLSYPPISLTTVRNTEQDQFAAYAMADLDGWLGGLNIQGNVGLRYVKIERTSGGYVVGGETLYRTYDADFDYVLPSLNLRSFVTEALMLRFSAAKVIANPPLSSLAPGTTLNHVNFTARRGNPYLKPYEANQYDLSAEWYFAPSSLLSGAVFYKDVSSFTVNSNATEYFDNGVNSGDYLVTQPTNGESGVIQGFELGYQQVFPDLPGVFAGSGLTFSYTYSDSRTPLVNVLTGQRDPLPILSEHSYNGSAFLERPWGNARLTYTWRDGFLEAVQTQAAGGNLYARPYGQLDATAQYNLAPGVRLNVEMTNITKEAIRTYVGHTNRARQYEINDRRLYVGVSASF